MSRIGHNHGPAMETGASWRRHCWNVARAALLPVLPVEVVRMRVKRAAALGLEYRTYAGVRAATGHDLVAFLFSSNALRVTVLQPEMDAARAAKLAAIEAGRRGLAVAPLGCGAMGAANPVLETCAPAPYALASWGETRAVLRSALNGLPSDRVLLVGDYPPEAEWCAAGRLAGYLAADHYFGPGVG